MCEHGLGSTQVDLGGIVTSASATSKIVSTAGYCTKKTISYLKMSYRLIIPGTYLSFFSS